MGSIVGKGYWLDLCVEKAALATVGKQLVRGQNASRDPL